MSGNSCSTKSCSTQKRCDPFELIGCILKPFFLLAVRLFWGYLFAVIGLGKLANIQATAQSFENIGIMYPLVMAYTVGTIETLGGIFLVFGLFTRFAAFFLSLVMIGAYATAHSAVFAHFFQDPQVIVAEAPFNFLMASLICLIFGPGKISVDYLLCYFFRKAE